MTPWQNRVTDLTRRMADDMKLRNYSQRTIDTYTYHLGRFAEFLGRPPLEATAEDVRSFQLAERMRLSPGGTACCSHGREPVDPAASDGESRRDGRNPAAQTPVVPSGLKNAVGERNHGLAPVATTCRHFVAEAQPDFRKRKRESTC